MDWKDIAGTVSKVAPMLGGLLGGPVGGAIGSLVPILANAFGLTQEETTPERINALLLSDPQAAIKLAEIEAAHKLELQKLTISVLQMELQDTADARRRQIETEKVLGKRDINLYVLAWVVMGGFIGLILSLIVLQTVYGIVLAADPLISLLVGSLSTDAGMVVGYFFGSSRGSSEKTKLLAGK